MEAGVPKFGQGIDQGIVEGWIEPPRRCSLGPVERQDTSESSRAVLDEDRSGESGGR